MALAETKIRGDAKHDQALELLSYGLALIPIAWPVKGGCGCGNPNCKAPGKHPLIKAWPDKWTKDVNQVDGWLRRWPGMNLGIVTGFASGVVVLDVDGPEGEESLRQLEEEYGPMPDTWESITGGGGRHIYFQCPANVGELKNEVKFQPGLDVRVDGGQVVAPGSLHSSGAYYEWETRPAEAELADMPDWLFTIIRDYSQRDTGKKYPAEGEPIPEGQRNDYLAHFAGKLRRTGCSEEVLLAACKAENENRCQPPLPEGEVETIARSIGRYAPGPETNRSTPGEDFNELEKPVNYFNKSGTFIPKWLGDDLMGDYHIKAAANRFWVYQGGVYRPEGEKTLAAEAQRRLGDAVRTSRIRETLDYIERASYDELPGPNFDWINVLNGRLNWRTGELHAHDPQSFEIVQLPVLYDPDATCPTFDKYLKTTLDEDSAQLAIEILGYCLIPDTRLEKAFMLTGSGRNGKSVFLSVLENLLGSENVGHVALQDLEENKFKAAQLLGKLANTFADLDSRALQSTTLLKMLSSGDPIEAERKFKEPFTFQNYARLIFSANEVPRSRDNTFAFYERWVILPFERVFDAKNPATDPNLRTKLKQPGELSGILNRALEGLRDIYANGGFTTPDSVKIALEDYKLQNDSVLAFCRECVELAEGDKFVAKSDFYTAYRCWCDMQGLRPVSQRRVKISLLKAFPHVEEGRKGNRGPRGWLGIRLNEEAPITTDFDPFLS